MGWQTLLEAIDRVCARHGYCACAPASIQRKKERRNEADCDPAIDAQQVVIGVPLSPGALNEFNADLHFNKCTASVEEAA